MISSLCSFLSADSESAMIIKKTNLSYLLHAISVFYLQKHPHATAILIRLQLLSRVVEWYKECGNLRNPRNLQELVNTKINPNKVFISDSLMKDGSKVTLQQ